MYRPNIFGESIENKPRSAAQNISFLLITVCFTILTATLYDAISIWILLPSVLAVIMRFFLYLGLYQHVPSATAINIIAVLAGGFLIYASINMALLETMINMLVLASSLKIMVLHTQKDLQAILLSLVFLLGIALVFHTGPIHLALYITVLFLLLLTLAAHFAPKRNIAKVYKKVAVLSLQALPIALILFLVIPTLPAFWHMPLPKQNTTGLTDTIKPGDIAKLGQSNELAFIATFAQTSGVPHFYERYWRSLVVDAFDGEKWFVSKQQKTQQTIGTSATGFDQTLVNQLNTIQAGHNKIRKVTYSVQLQKNQTQYAVSLDKPIQVNSDTTNQTFFVNADFAVHSQYPINIVGFYRVQSVLNFPLKESIPNLSSYLQVPDEEKDNGPESFFSLEPGESVTGSAENISTALQSNPRTQAWVKELIQVHQDRESLVAAFNTFLLEENFSYTLEPDLMPNDVIDTFLFDAQSGFCSHYASALGYVLRLAGYPTRLVAGYQGGELLDDNTLAVYQYDAHAWVETYDSSAGWIRLDPTGIVAPTRISAGLRDALKKNEKQNTSMFELQYYTNSLFAQRITSWLNHTEFSWHKEIAKFNQDSGVNIFDDMLKKIGIDDAIKRGLFFLVLIALVFGLYFLNGARQERQQDKIVVLYEKAKHICINNYPHLDMQVQKLPPRGFQTWLDQDNSELGQRMAPITELIVAHLFMPNAQKKEAVQSQVKELKHYIKCLKNQ